MISNFGKEYVALLHGLGGNRLVMSRIARSLRRKHYRVFNWGYRSTRKTIEDHAQAFSVNFRELVSRPDCQRVHVVTHSLGSIVIRRALQIDQPENLGRIVMLGPPNAGSHVARMFSNTLGRICRPLKELSDEPESYVNRLEKPRGVEIGIIAAEADRVVNLESTHLANQADHIVLPGHHGMLPLRRDTSKQVTNFLRFGRFRPHEG